MSARRPLSSPLWAQLFQLPEIAGMPLQGRLRAAIVRVVLDGGMPAGMAMPSSRVLAQTLGLSRTTVSAAYAQLCEEGYLLARPRSGMVVASNARPASVVDTAAAPAAAGSDRPRQTAVWGERIKRSLIDKRSLTKPAEWRDYPYPFVYGIYDPQLFPTDDFRECCQRSLSRVQLPQWAPDLEHGDVPELVAQIRQKLLPKRGVLAAADEVLITVGAQQAYYLLADGLFDRHTRVGLEEPGHPHARNAFLVRDPQLIDCPVDADGLIVDTLPSLDYVFVTPSHQSPTTHTLSLPRRLALLRRADIDDFVVIEDDYEAENLYVGEPMPALKSLDDSGRVIYIGSLSKSLSPALRLGYIVGPRELIAELRVLRHGMLRHPSAFLQHAYALFLSLGHHDSHARRVNEIMQARMSAVADALRTYLPDFSFVLPQGGASVWVQAPAHVDSRVLSERARHYGVLIEGGEAFFNDPPFPCHYFRMRLSSISTEHIELGVRALARAYSDLDVLRPGAGRGAAMAIAS